MQDSSTPVSLPIVAAITAALAVMLERSPDQFVITSVEPVVPAPAPSLWSKAGLMAAQMSRANFGQRIR
ncbi:MAG TPA: hypothetical protein VK191_03430 [Symbiobacteriaceae bacterium]|nr:hypothetical protein [Symbiobacteriaceae bacterium]